MRKSAGRLGVLVNAFVLDDTRGDVRKDTLGIALGLWQMTVDVQDLTALADEELHVFFCALVGNLSQPGALGRKVLVKIEQLQGGRIGGKTAGFNGGNGVSNWGVIRVRGSCLILSSS